jgi:hypothetical protein
MSIRLNADDFTRSDHTWTFPRAPIVSCQVTALEGTDETPLYMETWSGVGHFDVYDLNNHT